MKIRAPRYVSLLSTIGLVITSLAACDKKSESLSDALAQDSTLNLRVMAATGDTPVTALGDSNIGTPAVGSYPSQTSVATRPAVLAAAEPTSPEPIISPRSTPRATAPVRTASARSATVRRSVARRSTSSRRTSSRVRVSSARARQRSTTTAPASASTGTYPTRPSIAQSAPVTAAPTPAISRTAGTISAGSELSLVSGQRICSYASHVGDGFTTLLTESVEGTNGVTIPKGAMATAEITSIDKKKGGARRFGIRSQSISFRGKTYPVKSDVSFAEVEQIGKTTTKKVSKTAVATGTGVGAILGGVVGGGVGSTIIGAAGGAVAGAVIGTRTVATDGCIPERGQITAHLSEPLDIAALD
ncbi:MAG: hypothetical protein ABIS03_07915 [Gemmatimonadaceae bacterium]